MREEYLALNEKLDHDVRTGKLLDRDELEKAKFNENRLILDNFLNLPDQLSDIFAAESDGKRIHALLSAALRRALKTTADELERLANDAAPLSVGVPPSPTGKAKFNTEAPAGSQHPRQLKRNRRVDGLSS
jgi:hypothetical protein